MSDNTIIENAPIRVLALGGGLEGAEKTSRETVTWDVPHVTPDLMINPVKEEADARARDTIQNDGYSKGALQIHKDNIVGHQFMLNAEPDIDVLRLVNKAFDDTWAEEFQSIVESRFNLIGSSPENWFDASRHNTFTGLVRMAVTGFLMTGEVLASCEWLDKSMRPCSTAVKMISPDRLCNPNDIQDTKYLRRGVVRDRFGAPVSYWIRTNHPSEMVYPGNPVYTWKNIKAYKPWGRRQIIHIVEQLEADQTRGISDMVSVLKQMRMTRKFQDITLQKAVVNATYAGAIESELPSDVIYGAMGGTTHSTYSDLLKQYMTALGEYVGNSKAIAIDGVKIPHLFPGTKLSIKPVGGEGDVGTNYEVSLLRHICSALGLSYEQFSRDYTKTNYSSARASMAETWKYMQSRKAVVADRYATSLYVLWFEEEINNGTIPLPSGVKRKIFYDPVLREALCACSWIGASRGQIDEMKESQSAILRINSGISTYQEECANLGKDFRKVFKQRAREDSMLKELGLSFSGDATKPGANDRLSVMRGDEDDNGNTTKKPQTDEDEDE